jgi:hypothetical protein
MKITTENKGVKIFKPENLLSKQQIVSQFSYLTALKKQGNIEKYLKDDAQIEDVDHSEWSMRLENKKKNQSKKFFAKSVKENLIN